MRIICRNCGSARHHEMAIAGDTAPDLQARVFVQCSNCGVKGPTCTSPEDAFAAWHQQNAGAKQPYWAAVNDARAAGASVFEIISRPLRIVLNEVSSWIWLRRSKSRPIGSPVLQSVTQEAATEQDYLIPYAERPKIDELPCPACWELVPVPFTHWEDIDEEINCPSCSARLSLQVDDYGDGDDYFYLELSPQGGSS